MVIKVPGANLPALHKRLVVDTVNGKVRVRKWPEKRGPNVPDQVRIQNERFAAAQRIAKETKGVIMNRFIEATKGTGLYPRDLMTKMMLAPPIELETPDGRTIRYGRATLETVVFQGFIMKKDADFTFTGSGAKIPDWDLPVLDTSNFFNPAEPDRITIPAGVAIMTMSAGVWRTTNSAAIFAAQIWRVAPVLTRIAASGGTGSFLPSVSTGAFYVQEGEQYQMRIFQDATSTWQAQGSFFNGTILGAEV